MNKRFNWILAILIFVNVFSFMGCPKEPEINIYTVTFNANGGVLTSDAEQNILAGEKIINPTVPTRDGYLFTGWYTDQNCTILFDINNNYVNNNFTLYAGWNRLVYTITFDENNNNSSSFEQKVYSGDKIIAAISPAWDGYTFTGWYTDPECTTLYNFNQQIYDSFTLYAGWTYTQVPSCNVYFDANGGSFDDSQSTQIISVDLGNYLIPPNNPIYSNYEFSGWYTDPECTTLYNFNQQIYDSFTLYAGWEIKSYVAIFNTNGGTLEGNTSQTVLIGNKITQPNNPTRSEYYFTGWYTSSSCTDLYDFNNIITSNITLYAGWITLEEYITNIFNSLEGEGPHDIVVYGEYTTEMNELLKEKIRNTSGKINLDLSNLSNTIDCKNIEFKYCAALISIKIPYGINSIENYAFSDCTGLTTVEIPTSVTSIGGAAFYRCTGLTSIEIPPSVTNIGTNAFYGCTGLTSIEIPESVITIGEYAFYWCSGLTSIEIPTSVTSIGVGAFNYCKGLTSIEIPESVITIGEYAFNNCRSLKSITFKDTSNWFYTEDSAYLNGTSISVTNPMTNALNLTGSYTG